jgi:hypothetical protein
MISSFGLDGLDDHAGHIFAAFVVPLEEFLHFGQAATILFLVLPDEIFQRVLRSIHSRLEL